MTDIVAEGSGLDFGIQIGGCDEDSADDTSGDIRYSSVDPSSVRLRPQKSGGEKLNGQAKKNDSDSRFQGYSLTFKNHQSIRGNHIKKNDGVFKVELSEGEVHFDH